MLKEKAFTKISNLKKIISDNGLSTTSIVSRDYNYEFETIQAHKRIKVQVYFGKKGLKLVVQGDQNSSLFSIVNKLVNDEPTLELHQSQIDEPVSYTGTDEAGKGDIFGPLVIAAVYVDENSKQDLYKIGVRDSKDLSDSQIDILAGKIKKICNGSYAIIEFLPGIYNKKYEEIKNLNTLLSFGHSKAIRILFDDIDAKTVISDKFGTKGLEIHSDLAFKHVDFIDTEKAERFIGVAAASILARNSFNNWFYQQELNGYNFPKGSSEKSQLFLEAFVKKNGISKLDQVAKLHFKSVKKYLV